MTRETTVPGTDTPRATHCDRWTDDFHHARIELPLAFGQFLPVGYVRVMTGQFRVLRYDAQFLLAFEDPIPIGVPAVVEFAFVLVGPLLGYLMRGVMGAGG